MSETGRIAFTVLGKPEPQGSARAFLIKGKLRITSDNAKMKPWRQQVGWAALDACSRAAMPLPWPHKVPVRLTVLFVLRKPASAPKTRIWPTVKPDCDKLMRAIGDALTGILYEDDAQIVAGSWEKLYGSPERAEIVVEAL